MNAKSTCTHGEKNNARMRKSWDHRHHIHPDFQKLTQGLQNPPEKIKVELTKATLAWKSFKRTDTGSHPMRWIIKVRAERALLNSAFNLALDYITPTDPHDYSAVLRTKSSCQSRYARIWKNEPTNQRERLQMSLLMLQWINRRVSRMVSARFMTSCK